VIERKEDTCSPSWKEVRKSMERKELRRVASSGRGIVVSGRISLLFAIFAGRSVSVAANGVEEWVES
jgi:hypothetical protein